MIGSTEMVAIVVAALFLFGPQKLPELARSIGHAVGEFKKAQRAAELDLTQFDAYTKKAENKATSTKEEKPKEETKVQERDKTNEKEEIKDEQEKNPENPNKETK
ncbi:MAG: Sec-independent protein translocase subunit TatA/TatB [Methanosarcina sp.]